MLEIVQGPQKAFSKYYSYFTDKETDGQSGWDDGMCKWEGQSSICHLTHPTGHAKLLTQYHIRWH